jgi:2'-5' RNA ligase
LRSFIAIELQESARSVLADIQQKFTKCRPDIRWVKPGNIHLTVKFLGNVEEKTAGEIIKTSGKICSRHHPFELAMQGLGVFPNARNPKVLWVGIEGGGALEGLKNEIEEGMALLGFEKENRKFTPHLTIGRFRSALNRGCIRGVIEEQGKGKLEIIPVHHLVLMRSDLHPEGARYTEISKFPLSGTGEGI